MTEPIKVEHLGREFPVFDCGLCGHSLLCPKCGNNACNGGYGEIDGASCDVCPLTYDAQNAHGKLLAELDGQ